MVVPTLGRPSLRRLLEALAQAWSAELGPVELLLVDDRPVPQGALPVPEQLRPVTTVVQSRGVGPAGARNRGWRTARYGWVVFLDDDVLPQPDWFAALATDLAVPAQVGGVQGRVTVPAPVGRRPTDWERSTSGLATALWITADMAYRRAVLAAVGGFDERFPHAYREDVEFAYRVRQAGWQLLVGQRRVTHPVRPESRWVSLRMQRGNAADALLRRLYGRKWRRRLELPGGRRPLHLASTAAAGLAVAAALVSPWAGPRVRTPARALAWAGAVGWLAATGQFAYVRIRPGPRTWAEVVAMLATSVTIPPAATWHWLVGWWRGRGACPLPVPDPTTAGSTIPAEEAAA